MHIYLVGGSVRDELLDKPFSDLDYCVVDSNEKEMRGLGFKKVGADFNVFLHPETGDEYALARVERSTGPGYKDFETETTNVTLEEDLSRRDLTINAMAKNSEGELVDFHGGQEDIKNKVLRHVSDAFREDPIRVLRLARFRATLRGPQERSLWAIAHETKVMCHSMRDSLTALTPERIWKEVERVLSYRLGYSALRTFIETLYELRVLDVIFPEIYEMVHCKEGSKHHREANVFVHTMMMLNVQALTPEVELAVLYHDVAKPFCYKTYGASKGHDGEELVDSLLPHWIPAKIRKQVLFLIVNHTRIYKTSEMSAKKLAAFLPTYKTKDQLLAQLSLAQCDDEGRIKEAGVSKGTEVYEIREAWERISRYSPVDWIKKQPVYPSGDAVRQHVHNTNIRIVKDVFKKD